MKHKELTGFLVIAIILVLFALFFFLYSQFIGKMASFRIHNQLQEVYDSNNSGKSLTLSNEKVMELIEFASQDEKRWRYTTTYSIKMLFYTAILLLLLGSIQIALSLYIYKRNIAIPPKPGGLNSAAPLLYFVYGWIASIKKIQQVCSQIQTGQSKQEVEEI